MSTGHAHGRVSDRHRAELARIIRLPWYRRGQAIPKRLVRTSEIPWLGGSSTDLCRIFIDPRFAGRVAYRRWQIKVDALVPAVIRHEVTEGIILIYGTDERGRRYDYDGAHEIATAAELIVAEGILRGLGLPWNVEAYQAVYKPFLALTERGPWRNLPGDLNMEPYRQDAPGLYQEMERQLLADQVGSAAADHVRPSARQA